MAKRVEGSAPVKDRIHWQQVAAATIANLSTLCVGCAMGWTAPVLPELERLLEQPGAGLVEGEPLSAAQGAWVGALLPLGALAGSLPAGFLTHRYGRRLPLLAFGALLCVGWLLLLFHEWVSLLMVGRLVCGLASAGVTTIAPLYAEEVAALEVRGALGTLLDLMLAAGLLVVYGLGIVLPVRWLTAAMAALPLCFCVAFFTMPESPEYLRGRGKHDEAQRAAAWLRLDHGSAELVPEAGTSISPQLSMVITGAIQFVATGFSSVLVENAGRRPLMISSGLLMTFSHLTLAVHQGWPWLQLAAGWLPLVAINLFLIGFAVGLGPLSWLLIAELLPPGDKRWAVGAATSVSWLACALMTGFFDEFVRLFGTSAAYWVLGCICAAYTVFVTALLPETRGLTGHQIQCHLSRQGGTSCCISSGSCDNVQETDQTSGHV
ncbi:solute carrier family 2, facilitated glucose transporter member 8-like [Schistocerca cancellata]|uniref:solute carrier family 2, facilitated glucose transporter member 8-like n=1 Tax=Schistocerca cancellata TaxID=274614 RepID=UPI002118EEC3|nr:solute carrier family 2, facilitated glucose transporter member 8-like [Schistocerca cancellata]